MRNLLKGKISLIACGLLVSSSMAFGADSIDGAFKDGKVSGQLDVYTESYNFKSGTDFGVTDGTVSLGYETGSYMGLSSKVGFVGSHKFSEKEDGDYDSYFGKNAIMSEANITYAMDGLSVTAGRQAVSLEWAGDYHEAVVAAITAIPDTTLVLAYSDKIGVAGYDGITDFTQIGDALGTGKDSSAFIAEGTYKGLSGFEFTPYMYLVDDYADTYGLKSVFSSASFGAVVHYAGANVDKNMSNEDGSILHVEGSTTLGGLSLALGYIKTDKDGGFVYAGAGDDNVSPFEDGNYVYDIDAKTTYGTMGYTIAGVDLGLVYGETKYGSADDKEKELDLTVAYSFTESLSAAATYADVNAESSSDDYNKFLANVTYVF